MAWRFTALILPSKKMDETEKIKKLEEDYAAMQETMYLSSVPGMRDKIIKGINTPLDECVEDNFL